MKNKKVVAGMVIVSIAVAGFIIGGLFKPNDALKDEQTNNPAKYWTCGMHPSVRVSDAEYKKGNKKCPVCSMPLIPVSPEAAGNSEEAYYGCGVKEEGHCPHCDGGNPDAKCICGDHSFVEKGEKLKSCPVCGKPLKKIDTKDLTASKAAGVRMKPAAARKILYYRNPMNPNVTSAVPAKDPMGMDYIPVYEEESQGVEAMSEMPYVSRIKLGPELIKRAGVRTVIAKKHKLHKTLRTVGVVAYDPELAVAQEEFLTAIETREKVSMSTDPDVIERADDLIQKSRFKLRLLGMAEDEIDDLMKKGKAELNLVLPEDKAWIYADVYEYELGWVKPGQLVKISLTAYPGEEFMGVVKSISPVIDQKTRSAKVRIEADNKDDKLKPKMYADVVIESEYSLPDGAKEALAIPKEAIIDTGERKVAYVAKGAGEFFGRSVVVGPEAVADIDGNQFKVYPVLNGIQEGEAVVTDGNFLIDSQSQISGIASSVYGGALGKDESK